MNVLMFFVTFIWMSGRGRGGRRGRPRKQEMPISDKVLGQQKSVVQANVAEPVGQQAIGALARELVGALRESMGILRAENQVQAHMAEAGPPFLKREFF